MQGERREVMDEYFVFSNSFAAPFFSDPSSGFVSADTPEQAMEKFVKEYKHPCGLYSAALFSDANSYHKGDKPLLRWQCNHFIEMEKITKGMAGYSVLSHGPGLFEINHKQHKVENPKGGSIIY